MALAPTPRADTALASIHALLHKRDSRAATLWLGIISLLTLLGPTLYLALGFNRIRRQPDAGDTSLKLTWGIAFMSPSLLRTARATALSTED